MSIKYKIDIIASFKSKGYTTYKIKKEKILSEGVLTSLRSGKYVSLEIINKICKLLHCQPGDIMEYVEDENK